MQLWLRRAFFVAALFALVMALLPKPPTLPGEPGDKIQHMLAFATLGAIAAAGWRQRSIAILLVWLAGFGAGIEVLQTIPALHRDGDWRDWVADIMASAAALGAVRALLPRR